MGAANEENRVGYCLDIVAQIDTLAGGRVATVRDSFQAGTGTYQAQFVLDAASYACSLIVTGQATGRMYGETITFEVK